MTRALLLVFCCVACAPKPITEQPSDQRRFVVAIDAGHAESASGATSARGRKEFHFNRDVSSMLHAELTSRGIVSSFLINEEGTEIKLLERTAIASRRGADLFVSIHHDSVQPHYLSSWEFGGEEHLYSDRFRGFSIFYSEKNGEPKASLEFALLLGEQLVDNGFSPTLHHAEPIEGENRELVDRQKGVYRFDELAVLRSSESPAVLLECGVILHREEERLLSDPVYQRKLVVAVATTIEKFVTSGRLLNKSD